MIIYYPGLNSRFLLDDFYNLYNLEQVEELGYVDYIKQAGFSGALGRPLSYLTFAFQSESWPEDPAGFKKINLLIHIVNGVLIFFICSLLSRLVFEKKRKQTYFCILVTVLWLLHPIQLSTTLYVIQRMTQLSTLFIFFGVLTYLHVRLKPENSTKKNNRVLINLSIIIIGFTCLATLSKENGALLPLFILILEKTFLNKVKKPENWKIWSFIFLVCPILIIGLYLAFNFGDIYRRYEFYNFTLPQRLLTEAVVLIDYIKNILIPNPSAFSLYHDDYPISYGFLEPPKTIFAILLILILFVIAIRSLKTFPVISFAIYWFFGGHVLESTFISLELYFEHRNYLPSFGVFVFIAWLIIRLSDYAKSKLIYAIYPVLYLCSIVFVTIIEVELWSKPGLQIVEWSRAHPNSFRAINDLSYWHVKNKNYKKSYEALDKISQIRPNSFYPNIQKIFIEQCKRNSIVSSEQWNEYINYASNSKIYDLTLISALDNFLLEIAKNRCENVDLFKFEELIIAMLNNVEYKAYYDLLNELLNVVHDLKKMYK